MIAQQAVAPAGADAGTMSGTEGPGRTQVPLGKTAVVPVGSPG